MISIKNKLAISKMETAGQLLAQIMDEVGSLVKPGANALAIDQWVEEKQKERGLISLMKGFKGYRHVTCISVNDVVVHGVPRAASVFKAGDLVKIDVCASYNGYAADMARCYFVGQPAVETQRLADVAWSALNKGIEKARPGNRLSDISAAIQQEVEGAGFGVVRIFAGHGIGKKMHEEPEILNYGKPGQGPILRPGMTLALEPMITAGSFEVYVDSDGWTAKTKDQSLAAHVEDTVLVTTSEPQILTRLRV
jgi:methionyl aminopeptidase